MTSDELKPYVFPSTRAHMVMRQSLPWQTVSEMRAEYNRDPGYVERELMRIPNSGRKTVEVIKRVLNLTADVPVAPNETCISLTEKEVEFLDRILDNKMHTARSLIAKVKTAKARLHG